MSVNVLCSDTILWEGESARKFIKAITRNLVSESCFTGRDYAYYRKFRAAYLVYTFTPVLKAMSLWLELMGVTEKKASSISTLIWQANLNS
ncbi:hypothetical protein D3C81_1889020 [compost metagenome]